MRARLAFIPFAFAIPALGCSAPGSRAHDIALLVGDASRGEISYDADCARCHGGRGEGTMHALHRGRIVDLTRSIAWHGKSATISQVIEGVPGTGMPGFRRYSDQQLADIYAYLAQLKRRSVRDGR